MNSVKGFAAMVAAAVLFAATGVARGEPAQEELTFWVLEKRHSKRHVFLTPGKTTILLLYSDVRSVSWASDSGILYSRVGDRLSLYSPPQAEAGELKGTLTVMTERFDLELTTSTAGPKDTSYELIHVDAVLKADAASADALCRSKRKRLSRRYARKLAREKARCDKALSSVQKGYRGDLTLVEEHYTERLVEQKQRHESEMAVCKQQLAMEGTRLKQHVLGEAMLNEEPAAEPPPTGRGLALWGFRWEVFGTYHILHFTVENRDPKPYRINTLKLLNEFGTANHAGQIQIGKGDNRKGNPGTAATAGAAETTATAATAATATIATIDQGQRMPGAVLLRDPEKLGRNVYLSVSEAGGERPVVSERVPTWVFKEPPNPYLGLMSLGLQGHVGWVWLANPLDTDRLAATSLTGTGIRFTYGFLSFLHFEAGALWSYSGYARFEDVDINGMRGSIRRYAQIGRVQSGLLAYFRQASPRPFMRLGLGLQGAHHGATAQVDGERVPRPKVGFELDFLWYFGSGLEWKLGPSGVAGLAISGTKVSSLGGVSAIELVAYLGYSWGP